MTQGSSSPPSSLHRRAPNPAAPSSSKSSSSPASSASPPLFLRLALLALLLGTLVGILHPLTSPSTILGQLLSNNPADLPPEEPEGPRICQGKTPAQVVIDRVVANPTPGMNPLIVLRNAGGQTADLRNYRLTDSNTGDAVDAKNHRFYSDECNGLGNYSLDPTQTLTLTPKAKDNPCGFPFALNVRDEVNLFDPAGKLISTARWSNGMDQGSALKLMPDGSYLPFTEVLPVLDLMGTMGVFKTFLALIKDYPDMVSSLGAGSDPEWKKPVKQVKEEEVMPQFPWWFGFGVDRSKAAAAAAAAPPPPPPPPPPKGIPAKGPYTIMAPTDDAFDALLKQLGGNGKKLTLEQFKKLPEVQDILLYHILPGLYDSDVMFNNTPIYTAMAVELTPFNDPCMTEGKMMLHDNCIDKPTPDQYTCEDQVKFDKCYFPFMTSALAAQWQGGFCQRTCQRCSCAADSGVQCAQVVVPDVYASNGVVQTINRVMFPPPQFTKEMYANVAPVNITADMSVTNDALAKLGMNNEANAAVVTDQQAMEAAAAAAAGAATGATGATGENGANGENVQNSKR